MRMTEDQAQEVWCPMARAAFSWTDGPKDSMNYPAGDQQAVAATVNRGPHISDPCRCLGSKCAAWQWAMPDTDSWNEAHGPAREGYCGLAGEARY